MFKKSVVLLFRLIMLFFTPSFITKAMQQDTET